MITRRIENEFLVAYNKLVSEITRDSILSYVEFDVLILEFDYALKNNIIELIPQDSFIEDGKNICITYASDRDGYLIYDFIFNHETLEIFEINRMDNNGNVSANNPKILAP